ncbi:class I SAM-dependent methyltransferase [Ramlibacter tataouinensis]|uniref:class I SAM-dependent methyltransferase n=1 Tax=Ramlibacter tataouinensis TaxID=94132 RepID=UPI0022F3DA68|nr:class I SAM-dependent methyltransferase [Ramlibacter tataouinensis]WBY02715.1 class I SAM-dependent methyltransferase [Ramlibacter tataouinensis]
MRMQHGTQEPSGWIRRWSHLLPAGGTVLDVACGAGRHMRWLARLGHAVTGVDRDPDALGAAAAFGRAVQADIENGPWPFAGQAFDGVVVTNYLWRPLWPTLLGALAPDGVLLYETFAEGQAAIGKPSRPEFLLRHGELLQLCRELRIVAYEDGFLDAPPRLVQRIAAVRTGPADGRARHRLQIESAIPE